MELNLPQRRNLVTWHARVGGQSLYLRAGEFQDGTLGEIFVDMSKYGSSEQAMMDAFAISVSLGLQSGLKLETLVERFVGTRSLPNGMVTGSEDIKMCSSVHDYIFRQLGIYYLGWNDLKSDSGGEEPDQNA